MATGSLMMGTLKGKLGETVALRRSGKQVLRAYVRDVKNPNSQKQQVQRMVQSTVAQAYSAMKKICDHSFEGVQVGQKSMSYFMSKNMDKLRASIVAGTDGTLVSASADFVRKGVNLPVLNEYIVGKGTLPEVDPSSDALNTSFGNELKYSVLLQNGVTGTAVEALDSWIRSNSGHVGDWFTFLLMIQEKGSEQNGQQVYRFGFMRFVVVEIDNNDTKVLSLEPSYSSFGVVEGTLEGYISVKTGSPDAGTGMLLSFRSVFTTLGPDANSDQIDAFCCIHSRQNVGGSWQRSNSHFVVRDYITNLNITWPGNFFDELATYAGSAEAKGQGDYVLNGGQ